ncbi:MAG: tetratricopeptide repeat protein [Cyanobacteria bacterium P01_D01_bin.105]
MQVSVQVLGQISLCLLPVTIEKADSPPLSQTIGMETQVLAALAVSDFKQASRLLKQWKVREPNSPLLRLYVAQLQERTNQLEAAEKNYLALLKKMPGHKLVKQARAGIARVQAQQQAQKAQALADAKQANGGDAVSLLAIAPPNPEQKEEAIANLAKVFNLDAYTARMKLPVQGIRLHRVGPYGELSYFAKALDKTPTLITKVKDIQSLQTFQVCYFESVMPKPVVVCKNSEGQLGKISFDWREVSGQVSAQLPIFEQVVDIGNWGKTVHKEKVQDYAQVIDFHLPKRKIVVRLCDRLYQYTEGTKLASAFEVNSRIKWNNLLEQLSNVIDKANKVPHYNEFTRFGKGALEFIKILPIIEPNLDIDRRAPSHWDPVFHLYSGIYFFNR